MTSLRELIDEERLPEENPRAVFGPLRHARHVLLQGETLIGSVFAREHGSSHTIVGQAAFCFERLGFVVERSDVTMPNSIGRPMPHTAVRLADPTFTPSDEAYASYTAMTRKAKTSPRPSGRRVGRRPRSSNRPAALVPAPEPERPRALNNNGPVPSDELPVLPGFGCPVVVSALVLNRDGSITLGLRGGGRAWTATLSGVIEEDG